MSLLPVESSELSSVTALLVTVLGFSSTTVCESDD